MMEITQDGETISDIHNYLNSFNKEIQSNPSAKEVTQVFLDDAGQYYYHTVNGEDMVIVDQVDKSEIETDCISIKSIKRSISPIQVDNPIEINSPDVKDGILSHSGPRIGDHGQQTLQVLPVVDQREGGSQVILNSGDNNQIVTLVPSSTNPGEVSYVLIVEQTGDGDKGDAIYDFNEGDEGLTYINTKEPGEEESKKLVRIVPKKSQTIAPVHMCNYCNYTNPKRYLLLRHMKSHSEERPHKCSVCERGFKTLASLQNHVNTHTGIKPHRCKSCASTFTTSGELVRHVRYIHTHEKPHKCPDCDYASVEFSKLKRHMRCHTGERPYQCPHCTYASPDTFKLKRHLRIHTGEKPYECDICNSRFTQSNSLKAHKMIHTGNKPIYTCELCPTTCGRKTDLRIHIQKLHTSDKPLKCKKCAQTFPDRYTFKQHNKLHDGEKCFKCDLCAYASATLRHLESHMLVHTEQKPFKCKFCDQAFRQKQLLKRHENLYHDPFYIPPIPKEKIHKCHECCKTFRHKGNLLRHMSLHNPEDPLQEELQSGRDCRKRFDVINGVEVYSGSVEDQEMMTVEGQDGNQYVVLEVIQLQDNEDTVMMSDGIAVHDASLGSSDVLSSSPLFGSDSLNGDGTINGHGLLEIPDGAKKSYKIEHQDPKKEAQREMASCFGFDDEDDPSVMGLPFGE